MPPDSAILRQPSNSTIALLFRVIIVLLALGCANSFCAAQAPSGVEQLWQQAVEAQKSHDYLGAASLYKKILAIQPNLTEAEANLCISLHLGGSLQEAVTCFDRLTARQPNLFGPNLLAGTDYLKLDHADRALPYLKKAVEEKPDNIEARLGVGNAELQTRRYSEALDDFERATHMNAQEPDAWSGLGATYLSAEKELESELAHSHSPYRVVLMAESYAMQEQPERAADMLRAVVAGDAKMLCSRSLLGFVLLQQARLDEAAQQFNDDWSSSNGEGCPLAQLGLAALAAKRSNSAEALQHLSDAVAIDRDVAIANRDLYWTDLSAAGLEQEAQKIMDADHASQGASPAGGAALSMKRGRYSQCSEALAAHPAALSSAELRLLSFCSYYSGHDDRVMTATARILKLNPADPEALYWRIQSAQRLGIAALARANEISPESPSLHLLIGDMHLEKGDLTEAAAEYRKALALKSDLAAAHLHLARDLYAAHKFDEAEQEARWVLNLNPNDPQANFVVGEVLVNRADLKSALPFLLHAKDAAASDLPVLHADLSAIYEDRGDLQQAIAEMKLATADDPDGNYHYRLGHLYLKAGDRAGAAAALKTAQRLHQGLEQSTYGQK